MQKLEEKKNGLEGSFGLWKDRGIDGVRYQEKLRNEWERRVLIRLCVEDAGCDSSDDC
jgi:hypothetical protein